MPHARALLLSVLLLGLPALAHQTSISYGELTVRGAVVEGQLRFAAADVQTLVPFEPARVQAVASSLLAGYALSSGTPPTPCPPESAAARLEQDQVVLDARWRCGREVDELHVQVALLARLPQGHTHLARLSFGEGALSQHVVDANAPSFGAQRAHGVATDALRFLRLGVVHIFTGYDHIAFLLGLLLLGGTFRALVKIVTAFTVAHSITLALAALGIVTPSPRLVEPLIAASIVFIGVENLWALRRQGRGGELQGLRSDRALRHRWMVTFAFGLVHGFGFAAVLRELDLPRAVLATGLVSFNAGVEVGQLCIVGLAWPLLKRLRRIERLPDLLSLVVACLGAFWLVQRLRGG